MEDCWAARWVVRDAIVVEGGEVGSGAVKSWLAVGEVYVAVMEGEDILGVGLVGFEWMGGCWLGW